MSKRTADEANGEDERHGGDERRRRVERAAPAAPAAPAAAVVPAVVVPHRGRTFHASQAGITRLYGFTRESNDTQIVRGRYTPGLMLEEFRCSFNRSRPCLTAAELAIDPATFLCGIVYTPGPQTDPNIIRTFDLPDVVVRIADVQSSITGTVSVHAMTPFAERLHLIAANHKTFYANPMQSMITVCGDAFGMMLATEAMREVREETGLSGPIAAFERVRVTRNWATFKVNITALQQDNDGCRAFAIANQQPGGDFFAPYAPDEHRNGPGIPFKVQVYIYGPRDEFRVRIRHVTRLPFIGAEANLAGIVVFPAVDAWQFRVV
jgi:hypothetical protein